MATTDSKIDSPLLDAIQRASSRSLGMFMVGSGAGLVWGLVRGGGSLWVYGLSVGGNCAFASLPCFATREVIGQNLPDPVASALAGAIGGFGSMTVYSGMRMRTGAKGAIAFGLAGLGMERLNQAYQDYKVKKREELLKLRQEGK